MRRVSPDRGVHFDLGSAQVAVHNRVVFLANLFVFEAAGHLLICDVRLGHHNQATGVLVQPVNHARSLGSPGFGQPDASPEQGVDECTARIPVRRVNDQTGWFVHHHDVIVLEDNGYRYGFCGQSTLGIPSTRFCSRGADLYALTASQGVAVGTT